MGKGDQQRYLKITKIEIIFADAWQHLINQNALIWGNCIIYFDPKEQLLLKCFFRILLSKCTYCYTLGSPRILQEHRVG